MGYQIECQKKHLEQAWKGVHDCVVALAVDRKPSVLDPVNQVWRKHIEQCPQDQDAAVDDGTPQKKCGERLYGKASAAAEAAR